VLLLARDFEIPEKDEEDKEIVDAERKLDQVTRDEFEAFLTSVPEKHNDRKCESECHPHGAPHQGFAETNLVRAAVEYAEVERQHNEHEQIEKNPEDEQLNPHGDDT